MPVNSLADRLGEFPSPAPWIPARLRNKLSWFPFSSPGGPELGCEPSPGRQAFLREPPASAALLSVPGRELCCCGMAAARARWWNFPPLALELALGGGAPGSSPRGAGGQEGAQSNPPGSFRPGWDLLGHSESRRTCPCSKGRKPGWKDSGTWGVLGVGWGGEEGKVERSAHGQKCVQGKEEATEGREPGDTPFGDPLAEEPYPVFLFLGNWQIPVCFHQLFAV